MLRESGFDLILVADTPLDQVESACGTQGVDVRALQVELASRQGVDELCGLIGNRPVAALLPNAGRGLVASFLDQDFGDVQHVIDTNIAGTV